MRHSPVSMPRKPRNPRPNAIRQERLSAGRHAIRLFDKDGKRVNVRVEPQSSHPKAVSAAIKALNEHKIEGGSFTIASAVAR